MNELEVLIEGDLVARIRMNANYRAQRIAARRIVI
jgi:hypothetical protein